MNFDDKIMPASSANKMEDSIQQQQLGLPESLLFYLKKNANPKLLLKLMQVSKYFCFKEFPFLVIKHLKFNYKKWFYCNGKNRFEYKTLDSENLTKPIWITNTLKCYTEDSNFISRLLPKIAVCDIVNLELEHQIVTLNEFKILTSSRKIKKLNLRYSHVEDQNDEIFPVEKIIELLPMVKKFQWVLNREAASTFTSETAKNIVNFLNPSILSLFRLHNIPEIFDFMTFANFMDANPSIDYHLHFDFSCSPEYSKMLQKYVDKLLDDEFSHINHVNNLLF